MFQNFNRYSYLLVLSNLDIFGFNVHHLYVDSLFGSKVDASVQDFQALAEGIKRETHLPMDFEGMV